MLALACPSWRPTNTTFMPVEISSEAAYIGMWERHPRGELPASFAVAPIADPRPWQGGQSHTVHV